MEWGPIPVLLAGETHSRHRLGGARWARWERKPPSSPARSPTIHQGLLCQPAGRQRTRRKAGRKGEVPTIGCDSCPSPGSATTGFATLDQTTRVHTAGCQVPSLPDAAVGAQWPRGIRSPPPAAAPRGLVVFAAAEGATGALRP